MSAHILISSVSQSRPAQLAQISEAMANEGSNGGDDALYQPSTRVAFQTEDDTLPSPPTTTQLQSFCEGGDLESSWVDTIFSGEHLPPHRTLQEASIKEENIRGKDGIVEDDSNAVRLVEQDMLDVEPSLVVMYVEEKEEKGERQAAEGHPSPPPAMSEEKRRRSLSHSSSTSPEAVFIPSHQVTTSHRVMQAALRDSSLSSVTKDTPEKTASSASGSTTPLIDVPFSSAATTLQSAPEAHSTRQIDTCVIDNSETAAVKNRVSLSRSQHPVVLVSPTMVDDSPNTTNSWISPGRSDPVDLQTLFFSERRRERQDRATSGTTSGALDDRVHEVIAEDHAAAAQGKSISPSPRTSATAVKRSAPLTSPPPSSSSPSADQRRLFLSSPYNATATTTTSALSLSSKDQPDTPSSPHSTADEISLVAKSTLQRLQLRLNQAERAASLQQALREAAEQEKDDVQRQLDDLLSIQSELERRSQLREVAAVEAEQRHVAAKAKWEAEKLKELTQLRTTHDSHLKKWEDIARVLRAQAQSAKDETQTLRSELATVREELRGLMEEYLQGKKQLLEVKNAQAAAEQLCASLKENTKDVEKAEKSTRAHNIAVQALTKALRDASERAAVSELAFHALCDQLAITLTQRNLPLDSCEVSVLSTSVHALPNAGDDGDSTLSALDEKSVLCAGMSEESVAAAVEAALSPHTFLLHQSNSLSQSSNATDGAAVTTSTNVNATNCAPSLKDAEVPISAHLEENGDYTGALSEACRAFLRQRRQEVQRVLNLTVDNCRRITRETRAAADARAAEMERVLSNQVRQLQAQIIERQQEVIEKGKRHDAAVDAKLIPYDTSTDLCVGLPQRVSDKVPFSNKMNTRSETKTGDLHALQTALTETKRALLLEQRNSALLRKEVADLHQARYTTTALKNVEETLKDLQQSIGELVRDAVDSIQNMRRNRNTTTREDRYPNEEHVYSGGNGHWRRLHNGETEDPHRASTPTPATAVFTSPEQTLQVDRTILRSVQKAVLLAETQVERVGEELLGETRRGRFVEAVNETGLTGIHSTNKKGATLEVRTAPNGWRALTSTVTPLSDKQKRIYDDMKGLLHRSHAEENGDLAYRENYTTPPRLPLGSRYSPNGSRWVVGIRPPPNRTSFSPSSSVLFSAAGTASPRQPISTHASGAVPSPYVRAYVSSRDETPVIAATLSSSAVPFHQYSATSSFGPSSTALRLFEGMVTTTQELRNVADILEVVNENEATYVERRQACLLKWEDRIIRAVNEGISRLTAMLKEMHPPNTALERFPHCDYHDGHDSKSPVQKLPSVIDAGNEDDALQHQPQERLAAILASRRAAHEVPSTATAASPSIGAVRFSNGA